MYLHSYHLLCVKNQCKLPPLSLCQGSPEKRNLWESCISIYTQFYIYLCIPICMCMRMCVQMEGERDDREQDREQEAEGEEKRGRLRLSNWLLQLESYHWRSAARILSCSGEASLCSLQVSLQLVGRSPSTLRRAVCFTQEVSSSSPTPNMLRTKYLGSVTQESRHRSSHHRHHGCSYKINNNGKQNTSMCQDSQLQYLLKGTVQLVFPSSSSIFFSLGKHFWLLCIP